MNASRRLALLAAVVLLALTFSAAQPVTVDADCRTCIRSNSSCGFFPIVVTGVSMSSCGPCYNPCRSYYNDCYPCWRGCLPRPVCRPLCNSCYNLTVEPVLVPIPAPSCTPCQAQVTTCAPCQVVQPLPRFASCSPCELERRGYQTRRMALSATEYVDQVLVGGEWINIDVFVQRQNDSVAVLTTELPADLVLAHGADGRVLRVGCP